MNHKEKNNFFITDELTNLLKDYEDIKYIDNNNNKDNKCTEIEEKI